MISRAKLDDIYRAFGKEEPNSDDDAIMEEAIENVLAWSSTLQARESVLHAVHTYSILSGCRIPRNNLCHLDVILFDSALVLAAFILYADSTRKNTNTRPRFVVLELMPTLEFAGIVPALCHSSKTNTTTKTATTTPDAEYLILSQFLNGESDISFRDCSTPPRGAALDILFSYASLIDDVCPNQASTYSALLRVLGHRIGDLGDIEKGLPGT
jgi:hypothetical protein